MIDVKKLRGLIAERGYSQRKLAAQMGITGATFYRKMRKGVFDSDEMMSLIQILDIQNPAGIFFAEEGTN